MTIQLLIWMVVTIVWMVSITRMVSIVWMSLIDKIEDQLYSIGLGDVSYTSDSS